MRFYFLFLLIFLTPIQAVFADDSFPLLYSRNTIAITRTALTASALPWKKPEEAAAESRLSVAVEIRDASTLYNQKGWYNLSAPSDRDGILLLFSSPTLAPIISSKQYAPLDVLMIDDKGIITNILPSLMLSELSEEIYPQKPILAFLFLRGGSCEQLSITPGDVVEYAIFKKPPTMLSAPVAPKATPPAPTKP